LQQLFFTLPLLWIASIKGEICCLLKYKPGLFWLLFAFK
jgi:hypothetical protein